MTGGTLLGKDPKSSRSLVINVASNMDGGQYMVTILFELDAFTPTIQHIQVQEHSF